MRVFLAVLLLLAVAPLGGCRAGFPPPPTAHPDDPTAAELEADVARRSAPRGSARVSTEEESRIACAAMRVILGRGGVVSAEPGCMPPEWSVDALAVGPTGRRARVEIAHHGSHGRHPWTGWNLWLVQGADGEWRVSGLWFGHIA